MKNIKIFYKIVLIPKVTECSCQFFLMQILAKDIDKNMKRNTYKNGNQIELNDAP